MKSAIVALIGRPSSGKSTFLNQVIGHKVSIVSSVPQTTRNLVRGILTAPRGQLVFIDTPGFHLSDKKMNLYLKELATGVLREAELVLYLLDVTRPPGEEEQVLMELLRKQQEALVVGLNKIDLDSRHLPRFREQLRGVFSQPRVFPLSARTGQGVDEVVDTLFTLAPEGALLYPEEYYTDQNPEFRIAEIIREKAIALARQEVPHALFVEVSDLEMKEDHLWARAFIFVERESQKGIVVGKGGERIKTVLRQAEAELGELFPYPVLLDIRVKTRPKWRKDDTLLKHLIS